jgi:hypothetical protein
LPDLSHFFAFFWQRLCRLFPNKSLFCMDLLRLLAFRTILILRDSPQSAWIHHSGDGRYFEGEWERLLSMDKGGSVRGLKESRCGTGRGDSSYGSGASLAVWQSTGEGQDYGKRVSHKNVARLMEEKGLHAPQRRKFILTTRSNHGLPGWEHLLNREFHAQEGGKAGVSDGGTWR